ncbi:UDP-glucose/GDP-mannose dehydrogenase family protein [Mesobacillus maritimus]|uniref:UDP-glucose dehydrogenase family protein n=1 Tax=Mesobacillus maritimus TaxID=1643336 RepID=UPI002040E7D9|nr:UDP-glucose/GDP-mannose dehydrogenase family protein [Mesobacillus maritimus]MCM3585295.1 UDP-glucose/GDP-mannose dehydrogenase family protein [Mesobacillus maritimus]
MKVAILGTGYVGLSTGVALAEIGHHVCCMDVDEKKIARLKQGKSPIYEPGLEELLVKNIAAGRLRFTTSHREGISVAEIVILAVGTPQSNDGAADLTYLEQAAKDVAVHLQQDTIVVIKSTVPVGTNDKMKQLIEAHCNEDISIQIVSNPEFLRQGSAMKDTLEADRIIIGCDERKAGNKVRELYRPLNVPVVMTSLRSAEMIKYASNAFLAMKISFINGMANVCEAVGADILDVAKGMGMDKRIGNSFLQAGIGYGGSCFPKDVQALYHTTKQHNVDFGLLGKTMELNEQQRVLLVKKAFERFNGKLARKKIAMLGLAFKPETDDMREAPSIPIALELTRQGADVIAYDPVATSNAQKILGNRIAYAKTIQEAIAGADAVLIVTEWDEIKQLEPSKLVEDMNEAIIFDGRNCLNEEKIRSCSKIEYYPVGRPAIIKYAGK